MIQWTAEEVVRRDSVVYQNLVCAFIGLFLWVFASRLPFCWDFAKGRRRMRWPLVPYFLAQLVTLAYTIETLATLDLQLTEACSNSKLVKMILQNAALGAATLVLFIRWLILVDFDVGAVALTIALGIGYTGVTTYCASGLSAISEGSPCSLSNPLAAAPVIYGAAADLTALFLLAWKSRSMVRSGGLPVFWNEVVFFAIPIAAKSAAASLTLLDLNVVLGQICNVPAAVASTVAATALVTTIIRRRRTGYEAYSTKVARPEELFIDLSEDNDEGFSLWSQCWSRGKTSTKHERRRSQVTVRIPTPPHQHEDIEMMPMASSSKVTLD